MITPEDDEQVQICEAMSDPGFYPHRVESVRKVETHISHVFLTGQKVYKMKKPVDFGFLDFSTLEKRKYFCEREVALNRRLAPDVYLGVDEITRDGGRYGLDAEGRAVEYVVVMRQLPEDGNMVGMLSRGKVDDAFIDDLASLLTRFYQHSQKSPEIDRFGKHETIGKNCMENFVQTEPFVGKILNENTYTLVRTATESFLERRKPLFDHRIEHGRIRDCHGDLRADHVYMDDAVKIIDCIEFNERFRYQDIACDLAFLTMDLDFRGHRDVSHALLKAYVQKTGDRDVFNLIDFYKIYRAMVRLKVSCFHIEQDDPGEPERSRVLADIRRYMKMAGRYADKIIRPTVWVVCGMIASGKSTVADALAESLDIPVLRSDEIRKQLFGLAPEESAESDFQKGVYSRQATGLTYGKQLMDARELVDKGRSAILDATFGDPHRRDEVRRMAKKTHANLFFILCECPNHVIRERLLAREKRPGVSDARLRHFDDIKKTFAPFDDIPEKNLIRVDSSESIDKCMEHILSESHRPL